MVALAFYGQQRIGTLIMPKLINYKLKHPNCCLCGGSVPTESVEHAPPIVMFWDKQRLMGMEVPSCLRCNNGSRNEDQLAAFFAIIQSPHFFDKLAKHPEKLEYISKRTKGCLSNIKKFSEYFPTLGASKLDKLTGLNQIKIDQSVFDDYLDRWAVKQSLAHWYLEKNTIFSEEGVVCIRWLTNAELMRNDELHEFVSRFRNTAMLEQGVKNSSDQFYIKFADVERDLNLALIFAAYHGTAFMAVIMEDDSLLNRMNKLPLGNLSSLYKVGPSKGIYKV